VLAPLEQEPARHHRLLISELEKVAHGTIDRLMVFMPPSSAKTTYSSILFPAWMLARSYGIDVIGASYNAEYAEDISWRIMRLAAEEEDSLEYRLISESRKLWRTNKRGVYRAAGAGGGITGRRADLIIIDDPIKGREDADSHAMREKVWAWYRAEVIPRLKPGGRIVLIQTRWHHDDLAGRLLKQMEAGTGDTWRIISLPALALPGDIMRRKPGEALWPEWEDEAALARKRAVIMEREWSALYQQNPTPPEGALFKPNMMEIVHAVPADLVDVVRSWDLAASKAQVGSEPAYTVGLKLGRNARGRYFILDVQRFRGGPDEVDAAIRNVADRDGKLVKVRIPQDPGQAGKTQVLHLGRLLAGHVVVIGIETGDKETRAQPVASQVNIGNVGMLRAPWNELLVEEMATFPLGIFKDQIDALSGAFEVIGVGQAPMQISDVAVQRTATQTIHRPIGNYGMSLR